MNAETLTKKIKAAILSILLVWGGGHFVYAQNHTVQLQQTRQMIENGDFSLAGSRLKSIISCENVTSTDRWEAEFQLDLMNRIKKDLYRTQESVLEDLKEYFPNITAEDLQKWESTGALECKTIDGKKCYFHSAVHNLFRIDEQAGKVREDIKGRQSDGLDIYLSEFLPKVVEASYNTDSVYVMPQQVKYTYTITVKPNEIPEGETIRVWMPYPRSNNRQRNIKLLSTSQPDYIISPDKYDHKSLYMEGTAIKDSAITFSYSATYTSYNEFHRFNPLTDIKPYDTTSAIYKKYTAERKTHVIFTDDIKRITDSIVGNESNPYFKAVKIFDYIAKTYPWASAREYSTLYNIPQYVINNHHGDCGQVTLLFVTMARYAGIPAKWESGWMLHPGDLNLHDWGAAYFEGIGWVPVDQSFGLTNREYYEAKLYPAKGKKKGKKNTLTEQENDVYHFFTKGIDCYRFIVNDDYSGEFYPAKTYPRSETVDFQRGEVEWRGENLYFGRWRYNMEVEVTPLEGN